MIPEDGIVQSQFDRSAWVLYEQQSAIHASVNHTYSLDAVMQQNPDLVRKQKLAVRRRVPQFVFTQSCFVASMSHIGGLPPERAGALFGPRNDVGLLTHFRADTEGTSTSITFTLNRDFLNSQIKAFKQLDYELKGIVHSHPRGFPRLSSGDMQYLSTLFANPANKDLSYIFMPVVCRNHMNCYVVNSALKVRRQQLVLY